MIMFGSFLPSLLVGFSTTNFTRAGEPTLSWNQLLISNRPKQLVSNKPTFRLLCGHPLIRTRQLNRYVRKPDVQGLAIGEAAMLG
jgi:hypothetical protein